MQHDDKQWMFSDLRLLWPQLLRSLAHYLKCKGGEAGEGLLVIQLEHFLQKRNWWNLASLGLLFQGVPTGIGSTQNAAGLFSNTALWLNAPKQHYISSRWASGTRNVRQRCHMGAAVWIPGGVVHCSCEPSRSWLAKSPDRSCSARMHLVLTLLTPYTVLEKLESVFGLFGKESW